MVPAFVRVILERFPAMLTNLRTVEAIPSLIGHRDVFCSFAGFVPEQLQTAQGSHVLDKRVHTVANLDKHAVLELLGQGNVVADGMVSYGGQAAVLAHDFRQTILPAQGVRKTSQSL